MARWNQFACGSGTRMRRTLKTAAFVLVPALATALSVAVARAGDGAQFSSDCDRTYVNKQIGDTEQWAITWEIYGNATGNVFKLDGSAPSFIECFLADEDGENEIFDCYGSSACAGPPCGGTNWSLIATEVSIPLSFFFPPDVDPLDPFTECELLR